MCENFSFAHICPSCQKNFLRPSLYTRTLSNNIPLLSFYKYDEIKQLLHTKHTDLGYHIYNILAQLSFAKFGDEFHTDESFFSISVDDHIRHGYSHTAILNKHLSSYNITPLYNQLRAQNHLTYSGKSKHFRKTNPRNFKSSTKVKENIILVDDIVTTGTTLNEAVKTFGKENISFCLSLVDLTQN